MTEWIDAAEAVKIAEDEGIYRTIATIRNWSHRYGIGRKIGGSLQIDKKLFKLVVKGDLWGLQKELEKRKKKGKK